MAGPLRFRHLSYAMITLALLVSLGAAAVADDSKAPPRPAELARLWTELDDDDDSTRRRAFDRLVAAKAAAVTFLEVKLRPIRIDRQRVGRLIAALDDDRFIVRERASRQLAALGSVIDKLLLKARRETASPEVRSRLDSLLKQRGDGLIRTALMRRRVRAVRILEEIGGERAVATLKRLAAQAPATPDVKAAAESLRWMLLAKGYGHPSDPTRAALAGIATMKVGRLDWPQWGGWSGRNNTPLGRNIPTSWDVGEFDDDTGAWKKGTGRNIKWVARLGTNSHGTPVVAGGRVFLGTNNGAARVKRFPETVDLGCLVCFRESDGAFLWQHSNRKLRSGRVNDWGYQGVCSTPYVSGNRLWYVNNRCEVVCLDVEGFRDGENDGPYKTEESEAKDEADVVWKLDMIGTLGVFPHNMSYCSVTCAGDILFVNTSNGVDNSHVRMPRLRAPSFIALDRNTGKLLWTDNASAEFVLHGQWSSPAFAVLGGVPQVLFAGGDGWLYSFHARNYRGGRPKLLWKFDCNPKTSKWILEGRGERNNIIATPAIYKGLVYLAVGQDPEHGGGVGHLWCIDPTRRGDVSPTLAVDARGKPLPQRRFQAVNPTRGERAVANPNSAAVWHYDGVDLDGSGKLDSFNELMHRTISTVAIKDDLLVVGDLSGLVHCLDARTGRRHWTYDMLAECWSSPLIVDDRIYVVDLDGDVNIFGLSSDPKVALKSGEPLQTVNMGNGVEATPIVANNVLYVASRSYLFAIQQKPAAKR